MASPLHSSNSLLSSSAERLSLAPATLIKLALSVRAWSARTGSAMVGRAGSEAGTKSIEGGAQPSGTVSIEAAVCLLVLMMEAVPA